MATCFVTIGCKNETKGQEKKNTEVKTENLQETSFKISGMTCEIGCAKTIASKLSKKEGVVDAKVSFKDSIATVKFNATKTNKKELMAFVEGIGSGDMYKVTNATCSKTKKECSEKVKSCDKKNKKECDKKDTKSCDKKDKKACDKTTKVCDKKSKKECSKKDAKSCDKKSKKECDKEGGK